MAPVRRTRPQQRGITLVEALVALAVMAFGIMGVIGVQATLRATGDLSKQRAEAVRIAQARVEAARGFSVIEPPVVPDGSINYQSLATAPAVNVAGLSTNTTFALSTNVTDLFTAPDALRAKAMVTTVIWPDRSGTLQSAVLRTLVAGVPPGVAGALGVPSRNPTSNGPRGRHPDIPADAFDVVGEGTSSFAPPDAGAVRWLFDNNTGYITAICTSTEPSSCVAVTARLLSGFIRFATGTIQPTPAQAELPPSTAVLVQVSVEQVLPTPVATIDCYEALTSAYVTYFCALPVTTDGSPRWSGRAVLSGLDLATSIADDDSSRQRVCRYTPVRSCQPAVDSYVWGEPGSTLACTGSDPTPKRRLINIDHPLDYVDVTGGLINQNFLVISAGNDDPAVATDDATSVPFTCPADDTGTEFINGNTWHHQPSV
jgi:Prokaryotic N-terminal methylation motif